MEDNFHLGIKALIQNTNGEILLLKVNPDKLIYRKDWNGVAYWDIPGGRIKKGSDITKTLKTEIFEETGIKQIKNIKPFSVVISNLRIPLKASNESVGLILSAYTCNISENSKIKLSEEHVETGWFPPEKAAELLKIKYPKEFTDAILKLKQNISHKSQKELNRELKNLKSKVKAGDKYFHYKHPDQFYHIVDLGYIEATEEPCVVYKADYGDEFIWVRTESEFFAKVTLEDGRVVDRFTKLS